MTAFDVLPWSLTTMYAALKEKSLMKTRLMLYAEGLVQPDCFSPAS